MSLVTDSLTAGGTLLVTVGSGLQAYNELRLYQAVLTRLGITGAYEAYKRLAKAIRDVQSSVFSPRCLLPVNNSVWHLRARISELKSASGDYITAMLVLTRDYSDLVRSLETKNPSGGQGNDQGAELEEHKKAQEAELKALGLKSLYWSLIMLGSAAIFVAACIAIFSDLNP